MTDKELEEKAYHSASRNADKVFNKSDNFIETYVNGYIAGAKENRGIWSKLGGLIRR